MKKVRKQKHPKLPNGYGSIRWLGENRRRPYAVHPPGYVKENGVTKTPKAICYVDDWYKGFAVLTAFHAGNYIPGMERSLDAIDKNHADQFIRQLLADYNTLQGIDNSKDMLTFADIYQEFYHWKYEEDQSRVYSDSSRQSTRAAFKNCAALHTKPFADLRYDDLQSVVDDCPLKHSSKELIVSLFHQMYAYAEIREYTDKDYSAHVKIKTADDDEHGVPFDESERSILWNHRDDPVIEMLLIMCYSGFRINEYVSMEVNLKEAYFHGGSKSAAGKDRYVPIHSAILPLVRRRMKRDGKLLNQTPYAFRFAMYDALKAVGIQKHTPHDCRHTFSALCEHYKVSEADRKRMLGHSFQNDITNRVYGHRTVEELRIEIEKIRVTNL